MQIGWWGIATYLTSLVKSDPTDRAGTRLFAIVMCCVVAFLVGATLGSWVAGIAALVVLIAVLLAVARRAHPGS